MLHDYVRSMINYTSDCGTVSSWVLSSVLTKMRSPSDSQLLEHVSLSLMIMFIRMYTIVLYDGPFR